MRENRGRTSQNKFASKGSGSRSRQSERSQDGERREYKKPFEKKSFGGSNGGGKSFEKKPFKRSEDDRSSDRKPAFNRDDRSTDRKPFKRNDEGRSFEKKSFGGSNAGGKSFEKKPFKRSEDGRSSDRKPAFNRDDRSSDRKPFKRNDEGRSFENRAPRRNEEGRFSDRKTAKSDGDRSFAKKSFNNTEEKPYKKKQAYAGKNFRKDYKDWEKKGFPDEKEEEVDDRVRLNRFISNAGICSRRDADKLIVDGEVTVNGEVVTEMGYRVNPTDKIFHNGKRVISEKKVYLLLNKPKGFVTTLDDPHADRTVMDLVRNACPERIYPVGRLDKSTTGVLLFTNDGDMAKRLTHPSHQKKKIYHVFLKESFPEENLEKIFKGIELEDGFVKADAISYVDPTDKSQVGIEIHSGKNHIVRRIFEHFGFRVQKLDRVYFAGLTKKNVPRGRYRFLTEKEINFLKMS